ncbi:Uncharacterised protein [Brevundimonas vesicularis]|uniref:Uncharacterized protein n=1 Tax=Brevundimonas vesicularis TaxID=41276 RepID=A0A2X1D5V3_BREVE|nr:hypothetical protein [Brevundimonas vesicularis]SPU55895.1 Uncharacterised protein [Brevundimonas vesicularis]
MTRIDHVDADFVLRKRALRASWSAIAGMTGCSELELRRKFDASMPAVPIVKPALSPREKAERALVKAGLGKDAAAIVARLWHANGAVLPSAQLAQGIAGGGAARAVCVTAREVAKARLGLTFREKGFGLSPADLVVVSRLAEAWEAGQ